MPWSRRYCSTTATEPSQHPSYTKNQHQPSCTLVSLTLVSQPLAQFHILRTSTQGQEVTPHIQRGILLLKEVLWGIGVIGGDVIDRKAIGKRV